MNNSNGTKKSPVPLIIAVVMILAVIALKVLSSKEENKGNPVFMFLGVMVVVGGFAAVVIYLSIKAAKRRKLEGSVEYKKKTALDIGMYISAGVGGIGLLATLWSLCFSEKLNYLVILAELAVFIAGFSVTYNIFMKKKKRGDYADKEDSDNADEDKGEQ